MLPASLRLCRACTGVSRHLLSPALRTTLRPTAGVQAFRQCGLPRNTAASNLPSSFCRMHATGTPGGFMPSQSSPDGDEADLLDEVRSSAPFVSPRQCSDDKLRTQGLYRGMVDVTLENIDDAVTDVLEDMPGFDSTLAVGCPTFPVLFCVHPNMHCRII